MLINRRKHKLSDEELLKKYQATHKKVWIGELWNRYVHLVYGVCIKYLKNPVKAQDLTVNVFEKLIEKLKTNEVEDFKKWLYVVSKNECLMYLRKDQKWKKKFDSNDQLSEIKSELEWDETHENKLTKLEEAVNLLNEEQKLCVDLFYLKEKSYQEVANLTGFDMKKVKSCIQNGKRNLKNQLSKNNEYRV